MKWALLGFVFFTTTVWAQPAVDSLPLHHLVLVSFTESSTAEQRQQVVDDSLTLLQQIPGVETVAAGRKARADRPVHIKDYDVAIYVRLSNEKALANYSSHPKHLQLLQRNKPAIGAIKVIDFLSDNTNVDSLAE